MSVLCGWASSSEKGTVNGTKGDQTGREVKTGNYYNFGQNQVIRFKDLNMAQKASKAMTDICANNNIGYGQGDRTTIYLEARRLGWDINRISEIKLCNTDCSETCAAAINFAYGKELIPSSVYTGNIAQVCKNTGLFDIVTSFNESTLQFGDMPVKAGHHIIMALQNGSFVKTVNVTQNTSNSVITHSSDSWVKQLQSLIGASVDGVAGKETLSKCPTLKQGSTGEVVKLLQQRLGDFYHIGVTGGYDGVFGQGTTNAVAEFQKQKGLSIDGVFGQNSWKAILGL